MWSDTMTSATVLADPTAQVRLGDEVPSCCDCLVVQSNQPPEPRGDGLPGA